MKHRENFFGGILEMIKDVSVYLVRNISAEHLRYKRSMAYPIHVLVVI